MVVIARSKIQFYCSPFKCLLCLLVLHVSQFADLGAAGNSHYSMVVCYAI